MNADHERGREPSAMELASRSRQIELLVVFGLTVGVPVLITVTGGHAPVFDFGQRRLLITLGAEALVIALLWPWLARRGWAFRQIAGTPVPSDVLRGLGLAALAYFAYYFSFITWAAFAPGVIESVADARVSGAASPWVVVAASLVNPVFEEFLWLAYGITALTPFGARTAILVAVVLRTLVHVYQGLMALIGILPLALVFTVYYWRTRRLWPVVVAHVAFDAIGLADVVTR